MLTIATAGPAEPLNDSGTYYRLDENLRAVACNRTESEAFRNSGAASVATTFLGAFASVITTFEGVNDGFDEAGDPHLFMTMIHRNEHMEAEGHRTWHEAEATHRRRVDELKALLERLRQAREPQLELL